MAAKKKTRKLFQVAKELNLATSTLTSELQEQGFGVDKKQMTIIPDETYNQLLKKFAPNRWATMQDELARQETENQKRQTKEAREAALKSILDSGDTERKTYKPTPSVRQMSAESLAKAEYLEESADSAVSEAVDSKAEDSKKSKPAAKVFTREIPADYKAPEAETVQEEKSEAVSDVPVKKSVAVPSVRSTSRAEAAAAKAEIDKRDRQQQPSKPISMRGAVSNEDIVKFTPPPPEEKEEEKEAKPVEKKKQQERRRKPKQQQQQQQQEKKQQPAKSKGKPKPPAKPQEKPQQGTPSPEDVPVSPKAGDDEHKKKKRKRKTRKPAEIENQDTENKEKQSKPKPKGQKAKAGGWVSTGSTSGSKRKRKRERKRKNIDQAEVAASIKQTLAAMDDVGKRRKKKRRVEANVGMIDEETNLIKVTEFISTGELASLIDVPTTDLIRECLMLGLRVTINQRLDRDTIQLLAEEHNYKVEFLDEVEEEELLDESEVEEETGDKLPRSPVVTVMGHVDHGKTSLLDYIRHTHVVSGEAGGITQHIGAYEIEKGGKTITFLDTPGHEAFTAMRARGAKVTDLVVLVVAADDRVMPQTIEAIDHAAAAEVPIVVAINKMDKPGVNADKIRRELSEHHVIVEEWGGEVQSAEVSAKTGMGMEDLLDKILIAAEMLELEAVRDTTGKGTIIESRLEKGRGIVCTVLNQRGTLKVGDVFVAGPYFGRIRAMYDERGQKRTEAYPAQPVEITGFEGNPHVGDTLIVYSDEREAKQVASKRQLQMREQEMRLREGYAKTEILQTIDGTHKRELRIVLKGDVDGSVEAIADSLMRLASEEVSVKIIRRSVGPITESDVLLAYASGALIVGFNVHPHLKAREIASRDGVLFKVYRIIYELIEDVKDLLRGMHSKVFTQEVVGVAEVRDTFKISRVGVIAGCMVVQGKMERQNKVRILRDGMEVYTGELESLKRFKDDAKEVKEGFECGIKLASFNDIKVGDQIESLIDVEVKRDIQVEEE